jgi:hypothetical protein
LDPSDKNLRAGLKNLNQNGRARRRESPPLIQVHIRAVRNSTAVCCRSRFVVNLRDIDVGPNARLEVWDGDVLAAEIDPPDAHYGIWQAPPIAWRPRGPLAQIGLLLVDPDRESARLHVRAVALFDRAVVATSVIADPPPG